MRFPILVVLSIALLVGCHSNSAKVTFSPAALKDCGANSSPSAIEVHWDATEANPKNGVKVWINTDPIPRRNGVFGGDPGTLWLAGDVIGSATTGNWVLPGTTFIVTDMGDDILATVKVPSAPCK